jgi:hypothetical protein
MRRNTPRRLVGLTAGVLLALLTSGAVLPSSARGGCGSFAMNVAHPAPHDADGLELLRLAASPAHRTDVDDDRRAPCTGALCSGNPAPPRAAEPSVPPPTGRDRALTTADPGPTGPGSCLLSDHVAHPKAVVRPVSIFHPPRPSRLAR